MKKKLIALFLCFLSPAVYSQSPAHPVRGSPNCGSWVKPEDNSYEILNKSWLIGYLSGINMGFLIEKQRDFNYFSSGVTNEQIFLWMDKYCRENPLSKVTSGAGDLYKEMLKPK